MVPGGEILRFPWSLRHPIRRDIVIPGLRETAAASSAAGGVPAYQCFQEKGSSFAILYTCI